MDKKNNPPFHAEAIQKINEKHKGNDATTQANRLLEALQLLFSLTTQDLRHELDIMHPAGRVKELRARGFDIQTLWDNYPTACGKKHRMARYVYADKIERA
ncbi:MAG: helix-turn-helix domain-containing protein [Pseudomonadota bacterium]